MERIDGQHVLEELPTDLALLFAPSRYSSGAYILQLANIARSTPFSPGSFSRVFGTGALKDKFRILNNAG